MTLAEAQLGEKLRIDAVYGDRSFRRRLLELGLVPGTRVTFLGVAPLGDPLQLEVRGCQLSIRRQEAYQIQVRVAEAVSFACQSAARATVSV